MTITNVHEEDSLIVDIVVTENGVVKDLSGATVAGAIRSPVSEITNITASLLDAPNGIVRVTVPKDVFECEGTWLIQARVELGIESRTVYSEDVVIEPSIIQDSP